MTEKEIQIVCDRIKSLREQKGITQDKLSNILNVSRTVIGHYETDRVPPIDKLISIANYFETSIDYLLGRTDISKLDVTNQKIGKKTGLNDKSIEILENIKNTDMIKTINYLIEQEEMFLLNGFSPITQKGITQDEYNKAFEKAQESYEQEVKKVDTNCIPILSNIHNYLKAEITKEDMYIINGTLKKISELGYKVNRLLAEETINTNEIIENTFLEKLKMQLRELKKEVMQNGRRKRK